jgi:hypothetical protein
MVSAEQKKPSAARVVSPGIIVLLSVYPGSVLPPHLTSPAHRISRMTSGTEVIRTQLVAEVFCFVKTEVHAVQKSFPVACRSDGQSANQGTSESARCTLLGISGGSMGVSSRVR